MFGNCFPNTLDTTVDFEVVDGRPDTYVITGDIDAMWLRDSSAQVWPYLPFMREDPQFAGARLNSHCEEDRETHQKQMGFRLDGKIGKLDIISSPDAFNIPRRDNILALSWRLNW